MYEYKKGFTLIEVLIVMVLIVVMFSMSLSILSSFSNTNQKYIKNDFDEIKSVLAEIKYLKISDEKDISINCSQNKISLRIGAQTIDEKELKTLKCENQTSVEPFLIELSQASSTFELKVNKYGYASIQRI